MQVEGCKLRDYGGDYELFLEKNSKEAKAMSDKQDKQKELAKSQIKSKSKVSSSWHQLSFAHSFVRVLQALTLLACCLRPLNL